MITAGTDAHETDLKWEGAHHTSGCKPWQPDSGRSLGADRPSDLDERDGPTCDITSSFGTRSIYAALVSLQPACERAIRPCESSSPEAYRANFRKCWPPGSVDALDPMRGSTKYWGNRGARPSIRTSGDDLLGVFPCNSCSTSDKIGSGEPARKAV